MIASLVLLGGMLAPAQPLPTLPPTTPLPSGRGGSWLLMPQLAKGQELVYRGLFREEAVGSQVQFTRNYRMETRIFVLDTNLTSHEAAFQTVLRTREDQPGQRTGFSESSASSARLEVVKVEQQGKLVSDLAGTLTVPLEGPPTLESGMFVETLRERTATEQEWQVPEPNRPPHVWRIVGTEMVNGASCVKLVGMQQSLDWDRPRGDQAAWRRVDQVWMQPRLGYASRVERTIELREPAHREPTHRSILRYDLESSLQYPGQLYDNRRQEVLLAKDLADSAAPLLPMPYKYGKQLALVMNKISHHLENQSPTPFREAVLQVKRRVEAAQRGEALVPAPPETMVREKSVVASTGEAAPDFVTTQFTAKESARLRDFHGKALLMVFYSPSSPLAEQVLTYAQKISAAQADRLTVVLLSISDDSGPALRQREALNLTLPILAGGGLRISYDVATTPKLILIDASGIVRGQYLGWGRETPSEIQEELKNWLFAPPTRSQLPGKKTGS